MKCDTCADDSNCDIACESLGHDAKVCQQKAELEPEDACYVTV